MMPAAWPIPPPTAPCSCRVRRSGSGLKPIASSVAAVPATSSASSWLNPRRSRPAVASARRRTASSSHPIASLIHDQLVPEQVHQQAVMELAVAAPLVLALEPAAEEDIDPGMPVHRGVLLDVLDAPATCPPISITSRTVSSLPRMSASSTASGSGSPHHRDT